MKVVVLYHPQSEHGGQVKDYVAEFKRYKKKSLELFSLETIKGAATAELYGISRYPAFLVISDDGSMQRLWQGQPMPLMDELSYYIPETAPVISHQGRSLTPSPHATPNASLLK